MLDAANMEAVLRDFGDRNRDEDPVIHFYELFLKEYDAKKRMQRGVFYTPQPVVSYIVRSVHELLQTEFGIEDGLASTATWGEMAAKHANLKIPAGAKSGDPFVVVLDPATGTATFLVEVIDVIYQTLAAKWVKQRLTDVQQRAAWNEYVPKHLLPRIYGYELMMAPYAIAHMKIGLKLHETGYRFGSGERARIYLTNALESGGDDTAQGRFEQWMPALAHEAQAVNLVKRQQRFSVVIGNPPYSVSSQNDGEWIRRLCDDFKTGLGGERNIQPLSDDYIKFIRLALYYVEGSGSGLIGMITNREYIQGVIHRAIRKRLLNSAETIAICDLHGQRGELIDNSCSSDENVFEIEKGVAINIMYFTNNNVTKVIYAELIGRATEKNVSLLELSCSTASGVQLHPEPPYWFFKPSKTEFRDEYFAMPSLLRFFATRPVTGFATHRDAFAIGFTKEEVTHRLERFLDKGATDINISKELGLKDTRDWSLHQARNNARTDRRIFDQIIVCSYRPFDWRWVVYSDDVLEFSRRSTMDHIGRKTPALICSRLVKDALFAHVFVSNCPIEKIFLSPKSSNNAQVCLSGTKSTSDGKLTCIAGSTLVIPSEFSTIRYKPNPDELIHYLYGILHSQIYRNRYEEFLKTDFPHVPFTTKTELFHSIRALGSELVALHLFKSRNLDKSMSIYTGGPNPVIEKVSYAGDTVWIDSAQTRGFRGVPDAVWSFHIGGYQVCEKWLKDRKGRILSKVDIFALPEDRRRLERNHPHHEGDRRGDRKTRRLARGFSELGSAIDRPRPQPLTPLSR